MRNRAIVFAMGFVTWAGAASESFAQVQPVQSRSPQQVVINGQIVNGAYVTAAGGQLQSFTCSMPQQYTMPDGSSMGWACYEATTGVWLLNALPPAQAQSTPVPAPAPVQPQPPVYQQPQPPVYQQAPPPPVYQQAPPPPVYQQAPPPPVYQQAPPPPVYQQAPPPVIYQQPAPTVIYQQAPPPTVVYQAPPTVIYQQPAPTTVVYTPTPTVPVVVAPAYPPSVVLGTAAIQAAGRIASAAIFAHDRRPVYPEYHEYHDGRGRHRGWRD
jgi:hypothetical protein